MSVENYFLLNQGYFSMRVIEGKGLCALSYFFFTVGLIYGLNKEGYEGRYCFRTEEEAQTAIDHWDGTGDPLGDWIKHKGIKEYSNLNKKDL